MCAGVKPVDLCQDHRSPQSVLQLFRFFHFSTDIFAEFLAKIVIMRMFAKVLQFPAVSFIWVLVAAVVVEVDRYLWVWDLLAASFSFLAFFPLIPLPWR